jgi:hypothetical protein
MPIFSEIEQGRAEKKYSSPEIDDISKIYSYVNQFSILLIAMYFAVYQQNNVIINLFSLKSFRLLLPNKEA